MGTETEIPYNFLKLKMCIFRISEALCYLVSLEKWAKPNSTTFSSVILTQEK